MVAFYETESAACVTEGAKGNSKDHFITRENKLLLGYDALYLGHMRGKLAHRDRRTVYANVFSLL